MTHDTSPVVTPQQTSMKKRKTRQVHTRCAHAVNLLEKVPKVGRSDGAADNDVRALLASVRGPGVRGGNAQQLHQLVHLVRDRRQGAQDHEARAHLPQNCGGILREWMGITRS